MFLPNEKVAFQWVFSQAILTLLGKEWLQWIKIMMTDGDMNEIVQLEEALQLFMPGCFQQQCG